MGLIYKIKRIFYFSFNLGISTNIQRFIKQGGKIGKDCEIFPNVEFGSEPYLIRIGNHVRITNGVRFITHDGGMWVARELGLKDADVFGKITIGNNVFIGWNSIIMPGVTIGDNCVIGAGSIVTQNVQDNSVVAGIPAKKIKNIQEYIESADKKCDYTKHMSKKEKYDYLLKKYKDIS